MTDSPASLPRADVPPTRPPAGTGTKLLGFLPRWAGWGLVLPLVALNGWALLVLLDYFQPILVKFTIATLLAFILSYPTELLQRWMPRGRAVLVVLLAAIALFAVLGVTLIPTLLEQIEELTVRLPTWIDSGSQQLIAFQGWADARDLDVDVSELVLELQERLSRRLQALSGAVLGFLLDAIGSAVSLLLTVVLTFYILLHGERAWDGIFKVFPSAEIGAQIRKAFRRNFQNYFIGQSTLALLIGTAMVVAFLLIRIPFALLFGIAVGALGLIPFGAPFGIAIVSLLTSLKSLWLGSKVLVIAIALDQTIENAVAPQLIGGFVGLNPVWILASLLVGAKIGGLLGLVIAVPLASSVKSILDGLRTQRLYQPAASIESVSTSR